MFRLSAVTMVLVIYLGRLCLARNIDNGLPAMPDSCKGKTFCFQKHQEYPDKEIMEVIKKKITAFKNLDGIYISHRHGSDGSGLKVCNSTVMYDDIYEIVDEMNRVRFVVQSEKFSQKVRIEECVTPGRITQDTRFFSSSDLKEFKVTCVQKRMNYQFLVLNLEGTGFELASVKDGLPVCCSCRMYEMD